MEDRLQGVAHRRLAVGGELSAYPEPAVCHEKSDEEEGDRFVGDMRLECRDDLLHVSTGTRASRSASGGRGTRTRSAIAFARACRCASRESTAASPCRSHRRRTERENSGSLGFQSRETHGRSRRTWVVPLTCGRASQALQGAVPGSRVRVSSIHPGSMYVYGCKVEAGGPGPLVVAKDGDGEVQGRAAGRSDAGDLP